MEYSANDAATIKVYRIDELKSDGTWEEGKIYHDKDCTKLVIAPMYSAIKKKEEVNLYDEFRAEHKPCDVCKAPKVKDEVVDAEAKIVLSGKVGVQNLEFDGIFKHSFDSSPLIKDAGVTITGEVISGFELGAEAKLSIGGATTEMNFKGGWGKLEGLDEKLLPLGYIQFDIMTRTLDFGGGLTNGSEGLRKMVGDTPASIILMLYIDINGTISASATVSFEYTKQFNYNVNLIVDGKLQSAPGKETLNDPGTYSLTIGAEVKADLDAHIGLSAMLYFFNVNIAEVIIVQIGTEGEGSAELKEEFKWGKNLDNDDTIDSDTGSNDSGGTDGDKKSLEEAIADLWQRIKDNFKGEYKGREYVRGLAFKIRASVHIELFDVYEKDFGINKETDFLIDKTITKWGNGIEKEEEEIEYNKYEHVYKAGCATDGEYVYFIAQDNTLRKKKIGEEYTENLSTEPIHYICGIDEQYIYVVDTNDNTGQRCIYRVNKESGLNKILAKGVHMVYDMDEKYLYYTTTFDQTNLKRVGKNSGDSEDYIDLGKNITFATSRGDDFYISTFTEGIFGDVYNIYLVTKEDDEQKINEITFTQDVEGIAILYDNYEEVMLPLSRTLISAGVHKIWYQFGGNDFWMVLEGAMHISNFNTGLICIQKVIAQTGDPEEGVTGGEELRLVYYDGATGTETVIMNNLSEDRLPRAFAKWKDGNYYFLMDDENDTPCIFVVDGSFVNVNKVCELNTLDRDIDISSCSAMVVENTIYFYEDIDNSIAPVYRYTIN